MAHWEMPENDVLSTLPARSTVTSPAVHIRDLRKTYVVSQQEAGAKAALQGLVHRRKVEVHAVDGISFDVAGRPCWVR